MTHLKVVSRKDVLRTKLFRVSKVTFKGSTLKGLNKTHIHKNVLRDPIVVVFPMDEVGNVYLIRQYRYLLERTILEAVAGHVDKGEKPISSAERELFEETGIKAAQWEHMGMIEGSASVVRSVAHLFLARELKFGEPHPEEDEDISLVKIPLREAIEKVISLEIQSSTTMVGLFLLKELRKKKKQ
ncbi:MAG: hypothetical protein A3J69_02355 [Candidatus Levybacteria bacterium RIFCSPHIGHO2_02_FULL_42_12]|nr:MAG: hypothetical protein A3J69_02355 [Candidatus Levybacteria bacterium RIFCSPHIGHO2_02_FULL_42_12]